jgi:hypothetical protein
MKTSRKKLQEIKSLKAIIAKLNSDDPNLTVQDFEVLGYDLEYFLRFAQVEDERVLEGARKYLLKLAEKKLSRLL